MEPGAALLVHATALRNSVREGPANKTVGHALAEAALRTLVASRPLPQGERR